jgi:hypothetical protein
MRSVSFILCLLLISQICAIIRAQDSLNIKMCGEVHDFVQQSHDVDLSGNYAYIFLHRNRDVECGKCQDLRGLCVCRVL